MLKIFHNPQPKLNALLILNYDLLTSNNMFTIQRCHHVRTVEQAELRVLFESVKRFGSKCLHQIRSVPNCFVKTKNPRSSGSR